MSEKTLAILLVAKPEGGWFGGRTIIEILFFAPVRVIVARTAVVERITWKQDFFEMAKEGRFFELPLEDILKSDKHNYAIPNSEITKVERKSGFRFQITTIKKKHKWTSCGIVIDLHDFY